MSAGQVNVGDRFKCKRRGHVVTVERLGFTGDGAAPGSECYYRNERGELRKVKTARLLMPYRFERLPAATHPASECGQCARPLSAEPCTS